MAAAAAAAAAAARSAGCGGRNFLIISLGSFSRGSWCHLVGTGGGTVMDKCGGFSSNSVRLGFSEHTTLGIFEPGSKKQKEIRATGPWTAGTTTTIRRAPTGTWMPSCMWTSGTSAASLNSLKGP